MIFVQVVETRWTLLRKKTMPYLFLSSPHGWHIIWLIHNTIKEALSKWKNWKAPIPSMVISIEACKTKTEALKKLIFFFATSEYKVLKNYSFKAQNFWTINRSKSVIGCLAKLNLVFALYCLFSLWNSISL